MRNCLHCGHRKRVSEVALYFSHMGKTLQLELCADCRASLLAEDDIQAAPG